MPSFGFHTISLSYVKHGRKQINHSTPTDIPTTFNRQLSIGQMDALLPAVNPRLQTLSSLNPDMAVRLTRIASSNPIPQKWPLAKPPDKDKPKPPATHASLPKKPGQLTIDIGEVLGAIPMEKVRGFERPTTIAAINAPPVPINKPSPRRVTKAPVKRNLDISAVHSTVPVVAPHHPGYCYLALANHKHHLSMAAQLGPYPKAKDLLLVIDTASRKRKFHLFSTTACAVTTSLKTEPMLHVGAVSGPMQTHKVREMLTTFPHLRVGATVGRITEATLALFTLPKEAGTGAADAYDKHVENMVNNQAASFSRKPTITVPANLPHGPARALYSLFGNYQLDTVGNSSSHPILDTFRRLTDHYVYDNYHAENIIEVGPSLTRIARFPNMTPSHCCSPNIDGRDHARALLAANIAANSPNHPHQLDIIARGRGDYPNPVWMCDRLSQHCNVLGRVIYASYSLQDVGPSTLVNIMDAHSASIAIVALELPIGLTYVDQYYDADTHARWEITGDGEGVRCFPGFGDAGYVHKRSHLQSWLNGIQNLPLFGEIVYQFGSAVVFRFTRTRNTAGCEQYPFLMRTMMEKYVLIPGDAFGIPDFLTSAGHYERLVAYLTAHHDKFSANLMKSALERISVLTPAIVLGNDKYEDRWHLNNDQRISVAMAACIDVQKMTHRTMLAQRRLEVLNSQFGTAERRSEAAAEPTLSDRFLAYLRGEETTTSARTIGDWVADRLDPVPQETLAQTTALPLSQVLINGCGGRQDTPIMDAIPHTIPATPAPATTRVFTPTRLGYPEPNAWHPAETELWLQQQLRLPTQREARLLNLFDPQANLTAASNQLIGQPVTHLTLLQNRAISNWEWSPNTRIDLLIVGPAGTGKSTHARRICPEGTVVVLPTNELQQHWQAVWPNHATFTLDQAVANISMMQTATAILLDEVYQFPVGHVITLASLGIPVVCIGAPDQRRYNGPLGVGFNHTLVPVDHFVITSTIYRFGQDITDLLNHNNLPVYTQEYQQLAHNIAFRTVQPGLINLQQTGVARPGLHLTYHRANCNITAGTITIDASQGTENDNVYLHIFADDGPAFAMHPYAIMLALTRCRQTMTITLPPNTRADAPIRLALRRFGIQNNQVVCRGGGFYGSRYDGVNHAFESLDAIEHEEPSNVYDINADLVHFPTHQAQMPSIVTENEHEHRHHMTTKCEISANIRAALYRLHPEPPQPADLTRDKTMIRFRKPDTGIRVRIPQWNAAAELYESTILPHIGYPFSNSEVLASLYAVFDRYTKPQNTVVSNKKAFMLADIMFDRWHAAFMREDTAVAINSTAALFSDWFSNATATRLAQITMEIPYIDSNRPFSNAYFLKCQCKPKFGTYGFCMECGQGILATNKSFNASICPLIVAATKEMQLRAQPNFVFNCGYAPEELDNAVRATGVDYTEKCMSIDLSQQDSSHINVHRYFIGKVMKWLGFGDTIIAMYMVSRAKRTCKGLGMLGLLFEVLERLFSGEPGTGFFNCLHSTGTTACTFRLEDLIRAKLKLVQGDDNSVVPPPRLARLAINMNKETGTKQKIEILPYLDFANRIFTTTGRSFADPARMLAKYTMRMTTRNNAQNEMIAHRDQHFDPNDTEFEDLVRALILKHKIDYETSFDITSTCIAIHEPDNFYALLRDSKQPIPYRPTLRMSGKHEVIFEDLHDRCAPAAIAYISDVPINDVIAYVQRLRMMQSVDPIIHQMNQESPHPNAFFMTANEILITAQHFGIGKRGGCPFGQSSEHHVSLKSECGQHVVVIRGKHHWMRAFESHGLFGQNNGTDRENFEEHRHNFSTHDLLVVCIATTIIALIWNNRAQLYDRLKMRLSWLTDGISAFVNIVAWDANIMLSLPAVWILCWFDDLFWAIIAFSFCHLLARLITWNYDRRTRHPKPVTLRVRHTAYGTAAAPPNYEVLKRLVGLTLISIIATFGYNSYTIIADVIKLTNYKDYPSDELILFITFVAVSALEAMLMGSDIGFIIMSFGLLGAAQWIPPIPYIVFMTIYAYTYGWWLLVVCTAFYCVGRYYPGAVRAIVRSYCGTLFTITTSVLLFNYRLRQMKRIALLWADDGKEPFYLWAQSNMFTFNSDRRFKSSKWMPAFKWPSWSHHRRHTGVIDQYMDQCVRVVHEVRGTSGRAFMKVCHPDKMPNFTQECRAALTKLFNSGTADMPNACRAENAPPLFEQGYWYSGLYVYAVSMLPSAAASSFAYSAPKIDWTEWWRSLLSWFKHFVCVLTNGRAMCRPFSMTDAHLPAARTFEPVIKRPVYIKRALMNFVPNVLLFFSPAQTIPNTAFDVNISPAFPADVVVGRVAAPLLSNGLTTDDQAFTLTTQLSSNLLHVVPSTKVLCNPHYNYRESITGLTWRAFDACDVCYAPYKISFYNAMVNSTAVAIVNFLRIIGFISVITICQHIHHYIMLHLWRADLMTIIEESSHPPSTTTSDDDDDNDDSDGDDGGNGGDDDGNPRDDIDNNASSTEEDDGDDIMFDAESEPMDYEAHNVFSRPITPEMTISTTITARDDVFLNTHLFDIIGEIPLAEQTACFSQMLNVVENNVTKPALEREANCPTFYRSSPTQHDLLSRVKGRPQSTAQLIISGIAGCSKSTLYIAMGLLHNIDIVVPSQELLRDIENRALETGCDLHIYTQHIVFDAKRRDILMIDEVFLLPEYHVRAIFSLYKYVIALGDPYQTNDLAYGQDHVSLFRPQPNEKVVTLNTSFTVPQDVMRLAHKLHLIPDEYRSLSKIEVSLHNIPRNCAIQCPVITASRECKVGFIDRAEKLYTIATVQGARLEEVVLHLCERDLNVLSAEGSFGSGHNRKRLLWTMFTRHSKRAYLDLAEMFYDQFTTIQAINVDTAADFAVRLLAAPAFKVKIRETTGTGLDLLTFTPVTVEWTTEHNVKIDNGTTCVELYLPFRNAAMHSKRTVSDHAHFDVANAYHTIAIERC